MQLWTYNRPFHHHNLAYTVKFSVTLTTCTSQVYCNGHLVDEATQSFSSGFKVIEHTLNTNNDSDELTVRVGYYNWWNIAIEVSENSVPIYKSHPDTDIYFAEKKIANIEASTNNTEKDKAERSKKWQQNKHSIFADIGLGAAFFIVAKLTGDLTTAAFVGVGLGLALVLIQRFVSVDLLGGFAVFGTIMLLLSALFSLAFQSEHFVQLKSTFMGLLAASLFLFDGIVRGGRYFGSRFERYLSSPVEHKPFVIGLGIIGGCMAGLNYGAAIYLSEDAWLTYSTFIDMPIYIILFLTLTALTKREGYKAGELQD